MGGGDSLPLDGATSVALHGSLLAILHSGEGRVVLVDLEKRTYRLLGGRGSGPSDVPRRSNRVALSGAGLLAILDGWSSTVRVWDTAGAVRWMRTIGDTSWGVLAQFLKRGSRVWSFGFGIGMDSLGRVYVPVTTWEGDSVSMTVLRLGPDPGDSAVTPSLGVEPLVEIHESGGRVRTFSTPYVRTTGWLSGTVDAAGLVYFAYSGRFQVDTARPGGTLGTWLRRPDTADTRVPEEVVALALHGRATPQDVGPVRYPVLRGLMAAGSDIWIGLPGDSGLPRYDLVDRGSQSARRVRILRSASAASQRWAVAWTTGPYDELWLDIFDLTAQEHPSPQPRPLDLVPAGARRASPTAAARPLVRSQDSGLAGTEAPVPSGLLRSEIRCTSPKSTSTGQTVELTFGSPVTGTGELTVHLVAPSDSEELAASLRTSNRLTSSCRGSGTLEFRLGGLLPDTLTLEIAATRVTFRVLRAGAEIAPAVVLGDGRTSARFELKGDSARAR